MFWWLQLYWYKRLVSDIPKNYPVEEVSSSKPLALCVLLQQKFNILKKAEVLCTCGDVLSQGRMIGDQHCWPWSQNVGSYLDFSEMQLFCLWGDEITILTQFFYLRLTLVYGYYLWDGPAVMGGISYILTGVNIPVLC